MLYNCYLAAGGIDPLSLATVPAISVVWFVALLVTVDLCCFGAFPSMAPIWMMWRRLAVSILYVGFNGSDILFVLNFFTCGESMS